MKVAHFHPSRGLLILRYKSWACRTTIYLLGTTVWYELIGDICNDCFWYEAEWLDKPSLLFQDSLVNLEVDQQAGPFEISERFASK